MRLPHEARPHGLRGDGRAACRLGEVLPGSEGRLCRGGGGGYAAAGSWSKTEHGYRVDVSLPLAPLREAVGARKTLGFVILASDADEEKRQETLLGNDGSLDFWDEYPPSIEEYTQVRGRN